MSASVPEMQDLQTHWADIAPLLSIHNEQTYAQAIVRLNRLIDEIGTDQSHPLYELLDTLGTLIHAYEQEHYAMPKCSGVDMLSFFMEEHQLTQRDLPE